MQAGHGFDADFNPAAAGDAVEHDGQLGGFAHGLEVQEQPVLGGLVIVRGDLQNGGGTGGFGLLGDFNRFPSAVGACSGHHNAASAGEFHGELDHAIMLFVVERGGFAGGAAGDHAGHAAVELKIDELFECRLINLAVAERGDDGCVGAGEHGGTEWWVRMLSGKYQTLTSPEKAKSAGPRRVTLTYS